MATGIDIFCPVAGLTYMPWRLSMIPNEMARSMEISSLFLGSSTPAGQERVSGMHLNVRLIVRFIYTLMYKLVIIWYWIDMQMYFLFTSYKCIDIRCKYEIKY